MRLIITRIIAFYLDAFFVLVILSLFFFSVYLIDASIDLRIIGISLWGYYLIVYVLYYVLFEFFLQQTIAKKILNIKIIFLKKRSILSILLRTFSRFIPFDAISFLFNEKNDLWHDLISSTRVEKV